VSATSDTVAAVGSITEMLFPAQCAACGTGTWPICARCSDGVGVAVPPLCRRCGRPTENPLDRCGDCPPPEIDAARAPFVYEGPVSRAVKGMKFAGWRALAANLGAAMAEIWDLGPADAVTWVPLSRRRRARRGFDQAEALAIATAPRLGIPSESLLQRRRDTPAQARKGGRDRRRALEGAFRAPGSAPHCVILVDDVLTTGATASSCARALREAGARRVLLLTAARSVGGALPTRCFGPTWKERLPAGTMDAGLAPGSVVARRTCLR
jgi:ComF family protein